MFNTSGAVPPMEIGSVGRLARRLSKQESVAVREQCGELETETETAVAIPPPESSVSKDISRITTNESTSSSTYTYETAAIEPVPLTSPTSPTLAHGTIDRHASDDSDDDSDDDDTNFLSKHYVSRAQNAVAVTDYAQAETLYAKALSIAIARRARINSATTSTSSGKNVAESQAHVDPVYNVDCVNLCLLVCRMRSLQGKNEEAGMILSQACGYVNKNDGDLARGLRLSIDLEAAAYFTRQKKYDKADKCCSEGLKAARKLMKVTKEVGKGGSEDKEQQMTGRYEDMYEAFLRAKGAILKVKGDHVEAEAYDALLGERKKGRKGVEGETRRKTENDAFFDILEGLKNNKNEKEDEPVPNASAAAVEEVDKPVPVNPNFREPTLVEVAEIRSCIRFQQVIRLEEYFSPKKYLHSEEAPGQWIDINYTDPLNNDNTFLHYAVKYASRRLWVGEIHTDSIFCLLKQKGIDTTKVNADGFTAAELIFYRDVLYFSESLDYKDEDFLRIDKNFCRVVQALALYKGIEVNKSVNSRPGKFEPWLTRALTLRLERLSMLLMDLGADISVEEGDGGGGDLEIAVKNNLPLAFHHMITIRGVSYDKRHIQAPMLCRALEMDLRKHAIWLLSKVPGAANGRGTNSNGDTPLHIALKRKQFDIVRALLRAGADGNARNAKGVPAYQEIQCWTEAERQSKGLTEEIKQSFELSHVHIEIE